MNSPTSHARNFAQNLNENLFFFRGIMNAILLNSQAPETTQLLLAWAAADAQALEALTPRVYRELRRMAAAFMKRERDGQTLQATALVHEVYLRLVDVHRVPLRGKAHFFAICAQIMRRILVDAARKRATVRHGGALGRVELADAPDLSGSKDRELIPARRRSSSFPILAGSVWRRLLWF